MESPDLGGIEAKDKHGTGNHMFKRILYLVYNSTILLLDNNTYILEVRHLSKQLIYTYIYSDRHTHTHAQFYTDIDSVRGIHSHIHNHSS